MRDSILDSFVNNAVLYCMQPEMFREKADYWLKVAEDRAVVAAKDKMFAVLDNYPLGEAKKIIEQKIYDREI